VKQVATLGDVLTTIRPTGVTLSIPKVRVSFPHVASNTERGRMLATLGACSTFALIAIVDAFLAVAEGLAGDDRISTIDLLIFNLGGWLIVGWLGLLASSDKVDAMLVRLAKVAGEDVAGQDARPLDGGDPAPGRLALAVTNLWIPVTFMFLLAGWLVYASGGPTNSPFVSLPVTMMIIGQSVYHLPSIDLRANPTPRDLLAFGMRVLRFYAYPQLLFGLILALLCLLQVYRPIRTDPAPIAETMIATQLNLSIGMCVAFLARRFDRAAASSTG
jgi:hypothetical protein